MTNVEEIDGNEPTDEKTALKTNHEMEDSGAAGDGVLLTTKNPDTVRFVNGKSDDLVVVNVNGNEGEEFVGLRKDELVKFASDPYWVRLRIILLVVFAVVWLAMLVAAIVIIVVAPKCPPRPEQDWWETAVVYQVNPNTFLDTNGDGKGDIQGIQKELTYLEKTLHVTALNLGPMYPSPSLNFGYDVTDYTSICGHYGKMEDFDSLRVSMHKKGIKLILDFIPNHTSRKHNWFQLSQNRSGSFADFYIWNSGTVGPNETHQPLNQWLNVYKEPAWTWDEVRNEYFYHSFSKNEPDLNLRNAEVVRLLDDALLFWLRKQVDGFRFIGVDYLVEPADLQQPSDARIQPETYELIAHWREVLDNYSSNPELPKSRRFPRLLIADVNRVHLNETTSFVQYKERPGAHLPSNRALLSLKRSCDARCVYSLVSDWSHVIKSNPKIANWQVGNHEVSRSATRMGDRSYINAINMLLLTLPGTAMVYYGDELGMTDVSVDLIQNLTKLPEELVPRAVQRSPMQWSDKAYAGFSSLEPWLPVADDYGEINVEAQMAHGSGISNIRVFESLAKLKNEPSFQWGQIHAGIHKSVVFYVRQAEGFPGFLVAINFGPQSSTVNFKESSLRDLVPGEAKIIASTHNFAGDGRSENYAEKVAVSMDKVIFLKPTEGIVLKWELPVHSFF